MVFISCAKVEYQEKFHLKKGGNALEQDTWGGGGVTVPDGVQEKWQMWH